MEKNKKNNNKITKSHSRKEKDAILLCYQILGENLFFFHCGIRNIQIQIQFKITLLIPQGEIFVHAH